MRKLRYDAISYVLEHGNAFNRLKLAHIMRAGDTTIPLVIAASLLILLAALPPLQAHADTPPAIEWSRTYGGPENDIGYSVQVTGDGGCIIAGRTDRDSPNVFDVYLVKVSPLPSGEPESGVGEGVPIYLYGVPIALLAVVTAWFLQKRRNLSVSQTRLNP